MTSTDLAALRDLRTKVRDAYIGVQHTLTVDQRRDMRKRIATLSSLIRNAEEAQMASVSAALLASVSHATEHAPAIAYAALASIPRRMPRAQKSGVLAVLASAFKLK